MTVSVIKIPWSSTPPTLTSTEDMEDDLKSTFQEGIKPFLFCLKVTGLHHLNFTNVGGKQAHRKCQLFYRCLVVFFLIFNFIFSAGEFTTNITSFDAVLLNNIISSLWFLQVALFSLNNVMRCSRWDLFYKAWNSYAYEYKIDNKDVCRKLSIILTVCYIVWVLSAATFMIVNLLTPRPPSGFMVFVPQKAMVCVMIFIVIAYFYFISTWFLLTSQFTFTCAGLCRLLWGQYQGLKKYLEKGTICDNIESLRQQHNQICAMIELADSVFCVFVIVTVFSTIPIVVLTIYYVIFQTKDASPFDYIATWWSISLSTVQLCLVFLAGGALNYFAHKPAALLYSTDLTKATTANSLKLSVFLNRLVGQPIGMTAAGLFVLDKPTIITFVGSIVTYAIVMVQFKPEEASYTLDCNCNCTNL